jgi:hypothetical protein
MTGATRPVVEAGHLRQDNRGGSGEQRRDHRSLWLVFCASVQRAESVSLLLTPRSNVACVNALSAQRAMRKCCCSSDSTVEEA